MLTILFASVPCVALVVTLLTMLVVTTMVRPSATVEGTYPAADWAALDAELDLPTVEESIAISRSLTLYFSAQWLYSGNVITDVGAAAFAVARGKARPQMYAAQGECRLEY